MDHDLKCRRKDCPSRHDPGKVETGLPKRLWAAKLRPIKYGIDALLVAVPLFGMTYFLFDPEAFNAFTAWLVRVL
jgi:hypothetical protein